MSWIVEDYLTCAPSIRSESEIGDEALDNLFTIENAIEKLKDTGVLSKREYDILSLVHDGYLMADISKILKIYRHTASSNFKSGCKKVSDYLGGYFADDIFIEQFRETYNLNEDQVKKMVKYMKGRFNHKLKRSNNERNKM